MLGQYRAQFDSWGQSHRRAADVCVIADGQWFRAQLLLTGVTVKLNKTTTWGLPYVFAYIEQIAQKENKYANQQENAKLIFQIIRNDSY